MEQVNKMQEQQQQMLEMMQLQMSQLTELQKENAELRLQQSNSQADGKTRRPDRPTIEPNLDDSDWALFEDTWKRYKVMANLNTTEKIRMELRAACSPDVNKLLFEFVGPTVLDGANEADLLKHIRSIAVKGLHQEVHRVHFGKLTQADGEAITHYVARLKSQATLCKFNIDCSCGETVNYAAEMVSQQLTAGLRNQDHQSKILAEAPILTTLDAKVSRLQSLETSEESATKLQLPQSSYGTSAAAKSQYRRDKKTSPTNSNLPKNKQTSNKCRGCGRQSHPGKSMTRKHCPAFGKICGACGIEGHFRAVCEKSKTKSTPANAREGNIEEENEEFLAASTSFAFATLEANRKSETQGTKANPDFCSSHNMTVDG